MATLDGHALARCLPRDDKLRASLVGTGGDDKWQITISGQLVAWTQLSRSAQKTKAIGPPLSNQIAKQLKVPIGALQDIIRCSKGWRDYVAHLLTAGQIPPDLARSALGLGPNDPLPS